jgi:hypothetical protein
MTKPFEGVVLAPPSHRELVLIFSVTDSARYLDSLKDLVKQKDEDGVHTYTTGGGPSGQEAPQAAPQGGKVVAIGIEGNRAALGQDAEAVKKVLALIKAGSFSAEPTFKGSDVGGTVRLKALLDAMDAEGKNPFAAMKQSFAKMPQMGAAPGMNVSKMLSAYVDALEALARQVDTATDRLSIDKTAIAASFAMQPVAGSGIAKYLSQASGGELELLKYLPAGAMVVVDGKVGDLTPLSEWYAKIVTSILPEESQAAVKAMTDLMQESAANLGNEIAMSVSQSAEGPLLLESATKVKDVSVMKRIVESLPARMQGFMEAQKAMGLTMTVKVSPNPISYAGLQISEWEYHYDFNVQPQPGPFGAQQAAMQKAMISAFWGADVKAYCTFKDNTVLFAQGAGSLEALKGIIDGKTKSVADSEALAAALQGMPAKPVAEGYISLQDVAGFGVGLVRQAMMQAMMPAGQAMPPMPKPQFKPAPPIGFASWVTEGGAVETQVRVPVQAIISVYDGIKSMLPQAQKPAGPTSMPPPQPAQP